MLILGLSLVVYWPIALFTQPLWAAQWLNGLCLSWVLFLSQVCYSFCMRHLFVGMAALKWYSVRAWYLWNLWIIIQGKDLYPSKTLVMPILVNYRALVYAVYLVTNCSETGDEQQKCVDVIVVRCSLEDLRFPGTFNGGLTSPDTNLARFFFSVCSFFSPLKTMVIVFVLLLWNWIKKKRITE